MGLQTELSHTTDLQTELPHATYTVGKVCSSPTTFTKRVLF
jgi:hypothetical protein